MSNQVGRPSIFEGKTFFGATGIPSRRMALVIARFDDWLPEPLTVATRMVKSLTDRCVMGRTYFPGRAASSPSPAFAGEKKSPANLPGSFYVGLAFRAKSDDLREELIFLRFRSRGLKFTRP